MRNATALIQGPRLIYHGTIRIVLVSGVDKNIFK
jgi:hypothetical protein